MEGVLAVGELELVAERHLGGIERHDLDAVLESGLGDVRARPGHRIGLELDAHEPAVRVARGHGQQPAPAAAGHVQRSDAAIEPALEILEAGQTLVEEEGDVLHRHALDGAVVARGSLADRTTGPEEVGEVGIVERRLDAAYELAAEVVGRVLIEQDLGEGRVDIKVWVVRHRRIRGARLGFPGQLDDAVGVRAAQPKVCGRRVDAGRLGELGGGDPAATRIGDSANQAELHPEREEPGPIEADEALDQLVEAPIEIFRGHRSGIAHLRCETSRAQVAARV